MSEEIAITPQSIIVAQGPTMMPADVVRQVSLIQQVMADVMKEGEHYGKIPGCGDKPTLLQPGAQVLSLTFRLAPTFLIQKSDLGNGHREYEVRCDLASIQSGLKVGEGVGVCSTMESKYRWRNVSDYVDTGEPIPEDYKARKQEYRQQGLGAKQVDGVWTWVRFGDSAKVENPDIADTYNTVLKIASKRAFVHAVLNATAASDMFTQDIEDLPSAGFSSPTTQTVQTPSDPLEAAKTLKLTFGKHKGLTLRELCREDEDYLHWLAEKCEKQDVSKAARLVEAGWKAAKEAAGDTPEDPTAGMDPVAARAVTDQLAEDLAEATGAEVEEEPYVPDFADDDIPF